MTHPGYDNWAYYIPKDGTALISHYVGKKTSDEIVIPAYLGETKVSTIGSRAFILREESKAVISEGISRINSGAF